MAAVRAVLQRCDPALLEPRGDPEPDCDQAARMVLFLTDRRRMQKVLWRQLFVLDSMMSLLEGLESAQQLMTQSCPPQPEGGARGRWKALKVESRSGVEETEALLRSLQDRIQQIHDRRHTLTQLAQHLHSKRQQSEQLESSLLKAQNALQSCDLQLAQLRAELEVHVSTTQDVMQINLLAFNQSELCVELRPHPSSDLLSNELEPLRLSVTWSHDNRFRLQVSEGTAGLAEDSLMGRRVELSAALLEVMRCYVGQAELLSEIQSLRSSFAIDWRPAQHLLVYLKTASLVCHLEVEEGYPRAGRARLLSVRRDGQHVDTSGLKPPSGELRLTEWLVFLHSSPLL
ncbi:unnamed protein product [Oreochromis niloticus]|nr:unnamed protein product [Mustela putorius furo]